MSVSRQELRTRLLIAGLAVVLLVIAGVAVLRVVGNESRRNLADHMLSNLETMNRVLGLLQDDSAHRVKLVVDEPQYRRLAFSLLARPDNLALHDAFRRWITPLYQSRGFEDYALISADGMRVIAAGTPELVGRETLPATQEALRRAELLGNSMTQPIPGRYPAPGIEIEHPTLLAFQLACVRIDEGLHLRGFLCLQENPLLRLYRMLRAARTGVSGEAYAVDADGKILSPIRFERYLHAPPDSEAGWSLFQLAARVPAEINARAGNTGRFTEVVARLLDHESLHTGLLENYQDYRGRMVVGAGRWLPDTSMGIVIEVDTEEALRSYRFARNTLIALIVLGVLLIVALTYLDLRSRFSLARSEQELAAFRDYIPAELHMKSADGRYLMANPVYESSLKGPPGHVLGKTDAELYPTEEAQAREFEHQQVLRTGLPLRRNLSKQAPDGSETTYSIVRFPVLGNDQSVVAVGTVGLNITEQIRTQRELENLTRTLEDKVAVRTEQLAAARDQAEAAGRAKAEFLANMSHEIRTPLNAIIGMSHLVAHVNTSPRVAHYIGRIQASGRHLLTIVNDILDLSKIEAGKLPIDAAEFVLDNMLGHVVGLVQERADAKGLELLVAVEAGLPERMVGDSIRISQILINFANNAVKFTDGGEVILRVRRVGEQRGQMILRFEVEDTGIGIAADKLPLLFSPFQQVDGSMSRRFEGTGLGLAISRNLAELMGGTVDVRSRPGYGSVFSLELALEAGSGPGAPTLALPDLHGRCALVVDDSTAAGHHLAGVLAEFQFEVVCVAGVDEALEWARRAVQAGRVCDVAFVDWRMPQGDGLSLLGQLRELPWANGRPRCVLLAPGAQEFPDDIDRTLLDAVLAKPVMRSSVAETVLRLFASEGVGPTEVGGARPGWEGLAARSILVVEDNPINQEVVQGLLETVGVRVTLASDGQQAVQFLRRQAFDAVLMDVHLPVMDGFEATREIRKSARFTNLPIIALTANALEGDRERCLAAGMNDYIAKPIDPLQMFPTLLRYLPLQPEIDRGRQAGRVNSASTPDAESDEHVFARLLVLPGLDVAGAVARMMGRRELYVRLVRRITLECTDTAARLGDAMRQGDRERMREVVHGAKSLLGALGADALYALTVRLQQDLSGERDVTEDVGRFVQDYEELLTRLQEALTAPSGRQSGPF